jgi:hypothetical protein
VSGHEGGGGGGVCGGEGGGGELKLQTSVMRTIHIKPLFTPPLVGVYRFFMSNMIPQPDAHNSAAK